MKVNLSKKASKKGFTLVELLVVMAILAILIGLSVVGIGYALMRSRNIQRATGMANLDTALNEYFSDKSVFPVSTNFPTGVESALSSYFEGNWSKGPAKSVYCYRSGDQNLKYTACVSQEQLGSSTYTYNCVGNNLGTTGWPAKTGTDCSLGATCGTCATWDGSSWGGAAAL